MISFPPDQASICVLSSRKLTWTQARDVSCLSALRLKVAMGRQDGFLNGRHGGSGDVKSHGPASLARSSESPVAGEELEKNGP